MKWYLFLFGITFLTSWQFQSLSCYLTYISFNLDYPEQVGNKKHVRWLEQEQTEEYRRNSRSSWPIQWVTVYKLKWRANLSGMWSSLRQPEQFMRERITHLKSHVRDVSIILVAFHTLILIEHSYLIYIYIPIIYRSIRLSYSHSHGMFLFDF